MMHTSAPIAALLTAITAAPWLGAQTPAGSLRAADSAWSASMSHGGVRAAVLSRMSRDAWYLAPGRPLVRGSARLADALATDSALATDAMTLRPARIEVASDSSLGYVYGYTRRVTGASSSAGKYIAVWRRGAAGWAIEALVLTGAPEGDEPLAPAPFAAITAPAASTDARMDAMRTDVEFSARSIDHGLADAFTNYSAADGAILSSGASIVFGRDAIARENAGTPQSILLAWTPMDGGAASSNDLAYTVGVATILVPATTNRPARVSHSKYLTVWKRQPDGTLRFAVDGGNALAVP